MQRDGRCRYYKLASPRVANALEALGAISTSRPTAEYIRSKADQHLLMARSCYDHLAGRAGVALTDAMRKQHVIVAEGDRDYRVTASGEDWLRELGLEVKELRRSKRHIARRCLDWTERRSHIGGALGAELLQYFLAEGWLARCRESRALRVTQKGRISFVKLGVPPALAASFAAA
jgi:hypothetical protein